MLKNWIIDEEDLAVIYVMVMKMVSWTGDDRKYGFHQVKIIDATQQHKPFVDVFMWTTPIFIMHV